jgi:hypothetical protein
VHKALIVAIAIGLVSVAGASSQTAGPPEPTNLEVVAATQDSITLAWGPSMPGEFYVTEEGSNYILVAWGTSEDSRGPVTYTLTRDDDVLVAGLTTNTFRVFAPGRKPFRTCVTAQVADGRSSPPMCATWTKS